MDEIEWESYERDECYDRYYEQQVTDWSRLDRVLAGLGCWNPISRRGTRQFVITQQGKRRHNRR